MYVGSSEKICVGRIEIGLVDVEVEDEGCFLTIYSGLL